MLSKRRRGEARLKLRFKVSATAKVGGEKLAEVIQKICDRCFNRVDLGSTYEWTELTYQVLEFNSEPKKMDLCKDCTLILIAALERPSAPTAESDK